MITPIKQSLEDVLHTLFTDEDISVVATILNNWGVKGDEIEWVKGSALSTIFRLRSYQECPILKNNTGYIKIRKRSVNEREASYLQSARFMPILEPIVPYYIGTSFSGEYSGIVTSGTENKYTGILSKRNSWRYNSLRGIILG